MSSKIYCNQINRRRLLSVGSASIALSILGCGGGGGGGGDGNSADTGTNSTLPGTTAKTKDLSLQIYATGNDTATATIKNSAESSISLWTDPSGDLIQQALYEDRSEKKRIYYGKNSEILRIVDERSGDFMASAVINNNRTDYNYYNAAGAWQEGFAVIKNADDTYSAAKILSSPGLNNQQLNGDFGGMTVASFSLLSNGVSGLGTPIRLTRTATELTSNRNSSKKTALGVLDRLTDILFASAHAQTVSVPAFGQMAAGSILVGGGALSLGAAPWIVSVSLLAAGAYLFYKGLSKQTGTNLQEINENVDRILGGRIEEFRQDALTTTTSAALKDYISNGTSALASLNPLSSLLSGVSTAVSNVASQLQAASQSTWQRITSSAPAGITGLNGVMVEGNGTATQLTGSYDSSNNNYTFSGGGSNRQISGNGRAGGDGNYMINQNGTSSSGTVSTTVQPLGSCQTQQSSGGQGTFSKSYNLGKNSGTFKLEYDMYSIPDRLEVIGPDGKVLYSTGGLVSGSKAVDVSYSGGPIVFVIMSAPNKGTKWDYRIGCPT